MDEAKDKNPEEKEVNEQPQAEQKAEEKKVESQENSTPEAAKEEKPAQEAQASAEQGQEKSQDKAQDKDSKDSKDTKDNKGKKEESKKDDGTSNVPTEPEFVEQVISINRITKVTKGGKKLSFSALVVVGDTKGNVGYSLSKASEVATAIRKAMGVAKKNMVAVPMRGSTITHEIIGECGGARVLLKPASDGTGVIASGPVRAVCDGAGIHNILTKCHRSNNPINVVKATINGLSRLKSINNGNASEEGVTQDANA